VADLSPGYRRDALTFAGSRYGGYAAVWIDGAGEWCAAQLTFVDVGDEDAAPGEPALLSGLPVCAAVPDAPVSLSGDECGGDVGGDFLVRDGLRGVSHVGARVVARTGMRDRREL